MILYILEDKYIDKTVYNNRSNPGAKSSYAFEKGRHFCVLRKPNLGTYSDLGFVDSNKKSIYEDRKEKDRYTIEIGIFHGYPQDIINDIYTKNVGILIDMDKKICRFYDYDQKAKMKIGYKIDGKYIEDFTAQIQFQKGVIFVWIKNG